MVFGWLWVVLGSYGWLWVILSGFWVVFSGFWF